MVVGIGRLVAVQQVIDQHIITAETGQRAIAETGAVAAVAVNENRAGGIEGLAARVIAHFERNGLAIIIGRQRDSRCNIGVGEDRSQGEGQRSKAQSKLHV